MFFDTSHNQPWRTRIRIPSESMPKLPLTASFGKFDASFLPSLLMVVLGALTPTGASASKGDDHQMFRESIFPARAGDLNRQVSLSGFPPARAAAPPRERSRAPHFFNRAGPRRLLRPPGYPFPPRLGSPGILARATAPTFGGSLTSK